MIESYGVPKSSSRAALKLLIELGMLGIAKKVSPASRRELEVYTVLSRHNEF